MQSAPVLALASLGADRASTGLVALLLAIGFAMAASRISYGAELSGGDGDDDKERAVSQLNVTLVVFDAGIPDDARQLEALGIFPDVRRIEARLLPYLLRKTLVDTGQWGAVRVTPEPDPAAELMLQARILKSDGITLEISVAVTDSTGRQWLNQVYVGSGDDTDKGATADSAVPFSRMYKRIAGDLVNARSNLDERALTSIAEVALLRYAAGLAPDAFGDYLAEDSSGGYALRRLPARDDPMLARVRRIRQFEYLFTDTTDEQYEVLYSKIRSTYNLWLKYRRQMINYEQAESGRLANTKSTARRGSYSAIRKNYDNYRWTKIQEQTLKGWAEAFNTEASPTVLEVEGRVVALKGDLDARYAEWREILQSIYTLEGGIAGQR